MIGAALDEAMTAGPREQTLRAHDVWVATDSAFQRRCRLRQGLWRESQGFPAGVHRGAPLGSRLLMPRAKERLENYLSDSIREVVRREVVDGPRAGRLFGEPRIYDNLLSSQPLCFNLFAELQQDLALATRFFARRCARVAAVTGVRFEHSPGRGERRYTDDNSAFDVYVAYDTAAGGRGFLGIEVKYHEALGDPAADHRPRYDELAHSAGWWKAESLPLLRLKPMQQMWRDHLLAASLIDQGDADEGAFVFLAPRDNDACAAATLAYARHLARPETFLAWDLESVVADLVAVGMPAAPAVAARYLFPPGER